MIFASFVALLGAFLTVVVASPTALPKTLAPRQDDGWYCSQCTTALPTCYSWCTGWWPEWAECHDWCNSKACDMSLGELRPFCLDNCDHQDPCPLNNGTAPGNASTTSAVAVDDRYVQHLFEAVAEIIPGAADVEFPVHDDPSYTITAANTVSDLEARDPQRGAVPTFCDLCNAQYNKWKNQGNCPKAMQAVCKNTCRDRCDYSCSCRIWEEPEWLPACAPMGGKACRHG